MFKRIKIVFFEICSKFTHGCINLEQKILSLLNREPKIDYSNQRKAVAELILKTLTCRMLVREALLDFPKDSHDPSIQAAWHALCHLEADEELRRRDSDYASEQNDYLEMIAFTLQKGESLPKNIINCYKKYHKEALIPNSKGLKGIIEEITRFINL